MKSTTTPDRDVGSSDSSASGATATPMTDAKIVMLSQGPFFVEAVPSAFARELEMHAAAVRHSRDYWADREAALRRAIVEYVAASTVNVPADRVQKAWEKLRYIATEYSPCS